MKDQIGGSSEPRPLTCLKQITIEMGRSALEREFHDVADVIKAHEEHSHQSFGEFRWGDGHGRRPRNDGNRMDHFSIGEIMNFWVTV